MTCRYEKDNFFNFDESEFQLTEKNIILMLIIIHFYLN